jgi:hypothetical protein
MKKDYQTTINVMESCFSTMTEGQLKEQWLRIYPGGSGPLTAMATIAALIQLVAKLRGFDTGTWRKGNA